MEKRAIITPGLTPTLKPEEPGLKTASAADRAKQLDQQDLPKQASEIVRQRLAKG